MQLLSQCGEDDAIVNEKLGLQESEFWFKSTSHLFSHLVIYSLVLTRTNSKKKQSNEHQPDWQWESTYARQEEGVRRREGGYSGGWWRSLQHRSAESARARAPPQTTAAGLPLQLRRKTSHRKHTCTAGQSATSQRPQTKKTRQRGGEGKSDQIHTEKEARRTGLLFSQTDRTSRGARGSSRFYFWSPFNNLSSGSCWSAEHNFAFLKSFDMQVCFFFH